MVDHDGLVHADADLLGVFVGNEAPELSSAPGVRRGDSVLFEYGTLETTFRIAVTGSGFVFGTRDRGSSWALAEFDRLEDAERLGRSPQGGYTIDGGQAVKHPLVPQIGDVFDRYGPPDGRYTSPVPASEPYTYDQRSLPYLEDPSQYRRYRVIGDFSDIEHYYDAAPDAVRADVDRIMRRFNSSFEDLGRAWEGEIAPGFGARGGGRQVEMPMTVELLRRLGLIEQF